MIKALILLCLPSLALASEVYKISNTYYVRDLVETGAHDRPYFSCQKGSTEKLDLKKLETLGIDNDLLGRKLCDADLVVPGLGTVFAAVINFYSWELMSKPLGLQQDETAVQVTSRHMFTIQVQTEVWKHLNPQHRIAVLFHEISISLLKYVCLDEPACTTYEPSPLLAREITGRLFREDTYVSESDLNKLTLLIQESLYLAHPGPEMAEAM